MTLHAPQIVWLCILAFSLLASIVQDGHPRIGHHSLARDLVSYAIAFGLLWWGGFFAPAP